MSEKHYSYGYDEITHNIIDRITNKILGAYDRHSVLASMEKASIVWQIMASVTRNSLIGDTVIISVSQNMPCEIKTSISNVASIIYAEYREFETRYQELAIGIGTSIHDNTEFVYLLIDMKPEIELKYFDATVLCRNFSIRLENHAIRSIIVAIFSIFPKHRFTNSVTFVLNPINHNLSEDEYNSAIERFHDTWNDTFSDYMKRFSCEKYSYILKPNADKTIDLFCDTDKYEEVIN